MEIQALLRKLRVGERTLKRWAAQALIERPVGKNWPESVLTEGMVARHLLDQGRDPQTISQAREQGRYWLGMDAAFCVVKHDLLFETDTRDWLLAYMKQKAGVPLDQPAKLWIRWDEGRGQLEFIAGEPNYILHEKGRKIFLEGIDSDPDGEVWKKPPSGWHKPKEIRRIERKIIPGEAKTRNKP